MAKQPRASGTNKFRAGMIHQMKTATFTRHNVAYRHNAHRRKAASASASGLKRVPVTRAHCLPWQQAQNGLRQSRDEPTLAIV